MNEMINVLIVDDTAFMRKAIAQILESDPDIRVVDSARNGLEALSKTIETRPDVITMDIDMPVMDGLSSIRHIMIKCPTPIVALSSLVSDGAITFEALRLGVVDFVPKPSGAISPDIDNSRQRIIDRIKAAKDVNLHNVRRVRMPRQWDAEKRVGELYRFYPLEYVIAVGTTLAGPNTVIRILSRLMPTIPAAVVVLQEISPKIIQSFVDKFNEYVPWKVETAEDGVVMEQGTCYIGSTEFSLTLQLNETGVPVLKKGDRTREPLNRLFSTAADTFGRNTIGVLLSGLGVDGAQGLGKIKSVSGITMAKNATFCVFPNLTDNAIQQGVVDIVLEENEITSAIESYMA